MYVHLEQPLGTVSHVALVQGLLADTVPGVSNSYYKSYRHIREVFINCGKRLFLLSSFGTIVRGYHI